MKFHCPYCRKECDFMEIQLSSDLSAIIAMSDTFGRHRALVWAYAEIFGIVPFHAKAKKLRRLLEEMKKLFDAEAFSYQKRQYRISADGIAEALNFMVHRNFPDGIDSHNYLKKIMIGIAERENKDAGRQAEKDLRKREAAAMGGSRDGKSLTSHVNDSLYPVPEEQVEAPAMKTISSAHLTDEQFEENKRRLKALMKGIGD